MRDRRARMASCRGMREDASRRRQHTRVASLSQEDVCLIVSVVAYLQPSASINSSISSIKSGDAAQSSPPNLTVTSVITTSKSVWFSTSTQRVIDTLVKAMYVVRVLHSPNDSAFTIRRVMHGLHDDILYHIQLLNGSPDNIGIKVALWQLECQ